MNRWYFGGVYEKDDWRDGYTGHGHLPGFGLINCNVLNP